MGYCEYTATNVIRLKKESQFLVSKVATEAAVLAVTCYFLLLLGFRALYILSTNQILVENIREMFYVLFI